MKIFSVKDILKIFSKQVINWEKIFLKYITDKRNIFNIHKELVKYKKKLKVGKIF